MVCRQTVTASSPATVAGVNPLEKELLFRILDRLVTGWYRCLSKRIESGTQGATGRKYASGKEGGAGEHTATNYESVAGNQICGISDIKCKFDAERVEWSNTQRRQRICEEVRSHYGDANESTE